MRLGGRLAGYLFREVWGGVLLVTTVTLSAILLVDAVEQLRSVGTRTELSLTQALQLTLLRAPQLLEQTLPFIMLTGVLLALVRLNRRSEITVMRAAGLSAWALAAPAGALALMLGLVTAAALSPVGSVLQQRYVATRQALLGERAGENGYWFALGYPGGQLVVEAHTVDPVTGELGEVTLQFFATDPRSGARRLVRRVDAPRGRLTGEALEVYDALEQAPNADPVRYDALRTPSALQPSSLMRRQQDPEGTPVYDLPRAIGEARMAGLQAQRMETRLNETLATPALLAAMALIAVAFSLRLQRLGGVAAWLLVGVTAGFIAYFFGEISNALASVGAVPALAAGWGPPLAALFAGCAALTTLEHARG